MNKLSVKVNKLFIAVLMAKLCLAYPLLAAEYTTNDWAAAQAQWRAARVAWTNEMAKAVAAGLITPRKAKTGNPKRRQPGAAALQAERTPVLSKSQASYFNNRRICVKRDTTTIPGYVITTWHRNGKLDTLAPAVVTNQLKQIVGKEQHNPIQEIAEQMRQRAEEWQTLATNATARIERVTAALDERREEYVEKRDAAVLPTTKALYQAFIDAIDRIKERLDERNNP